MTHGKLYGGHEPGPKRPLPFLWLLAFAVVSAMLVVAVVRGEW